MKFGSIRVDSRSRVKKSDSTHSRILDFSYKNAIMYNMEELDNLAVNFGKNVTRLRKLENMTQVELAEKLNYSDKAISKWEQGYSLPDVRVLVQIAELFGVTVDDLIREHKIGEAVVPKSTKRRNRLITTLCSIGLCWLIAVVSYVLLGIFGEDLGYKWLAFVFAVPASSIVLLVFSSIWHWKWTRIISISVLIWTSIACIYFVAEAFGAGGRIWLLFLIGIPLQLLALFYFVWRKKAHFRG